jgi:hypothetical protein
MSVNKITFQKQCGSILEIPVAYCELHEESLLDYAYRTICASEGLRLKVGGSCEAALKENGITNIRLS